MSIGEMCDSSFDDLALAIATDGKVDFDPLFELAERHVTAKEPCTDFASETVAMLYRVGAIGVKLSAADQFIYAHTDEPLVAANLMTSETRFRIHPMLHGAFHLQGADGAKGTV